MEKRSGDWMQRYATEKRSLSLGCSPNVPEAQMDLYKDELRELIQKLKGQSRIKAVTDAVPLPLEHAHKLYVIFSLTHSCTGQEHGEEVRYRRW
jgi:hypothetical protein